MATEELYFRHTLSEDKYDEFHESNTLTLNLSNNEDYLDRVTSVANFFMRFAETSLGISPFDIHAVVDAIMENYKEMLESQEEEEFDE